MRALAISGDNFFENVEHICNLLVTHLIHRVLSDQEFTPQDYVGVARQWVEQGVQIIGGCCGIELEHIRPLREALPSHVPVAG
jgi:hypothetical protein